MRYTPGRTATRWSFFPGLVIIFAAVGCGNATGTVTGTVTLDGEPLKAGNVTFARTDGKQTMLAEIQEDGSYTMINVPAGSAKVCVETKSLKPTIGAPSGSGPRIGVPAGGGVVPKNVPAEGTVPPGGDGHYVPGGGAGTKAHLFVAIPDKYSDPTQTPLSFEVKRGSQKYAIELKSK
jgi:hypothetical protein